MPFYPYNLSIIPDHLDLVCVKQAISPKHFDRDYDKNKQKEIKKALKSLKPSKVYYIYIYIYIYIYRIDKIKIKTKINIYIYIYIYIIHI